MDNTVYQQLYDEGLISESSFEKIKQQQSSPLFSLHWELKTLLYLGVMLLSTGLGILIYKNIDTIGHQVILLIIAAISVFSYAWCAKVKKPFSYEKVESPNAFFDYILLLGTLSFLSFLAYLQFQYEVFGTNYRLATFIPMLVLFLTAYYFDHLGILSMAIANLAVWMGISVTPKHVLASSNFHNETIFYTYMALGFLLLTAAYLSNRFNFKKHFAFSYQHYGLHLAFIALLAAYFYYDFLPSLFWLAVLGIAAWFIYKEAFKAKSFYFVLLVLLYSYIGLSGLVVRLLDNATDVIVGFGFIYFIVSGIGLILLLIELNKKIKAL